MLGAFLAASLLWLAWQLGPSSLLSLCPLRPSALKKFMTCAWLLLSAPLIALRNIIALSLILTGPQRGGAFISCRLDRQVSDLNWRIAHGITYTADRLNSFGYHFDPMCFCGGIEDPEHLFFSCSLAQRGIAWVRPLYHLASPQAPVISSRILLFGFTRDELLCVPKVFAYIINVLKYLIWRQRNDFRFRGVTPSHQRLIAQLRARVSFFLPLLFKRFRSPRKQRLFLRQWGANGTLGFLTGDSFKVTF